MTQSSNKFEALLELLINEENDKAEQLFHEIVVEKSRDIYENLASTETKDDSVDENKEDKDEAVKETEKSDTTDEEVKETEKSDKDETVEETVDEVKAEGRIRLIRNDAWGGGTPTITLNNGSATAYTFSTGTTVEDAADSIATNISAATDYTAVVSTSGNVQAIGSFIISGNTF